MNNSFNIRHLLTDEISLEGLDGITLQALWIRISQATNTTLPFPESLQKQYWDIIRKNQDFNFYELPEERLDYVPYDRFKYIDLECDATYDEPEDIPEDIYTYKLVHDISKGIKGSCATYFTRTDISGKARNFDYIKAKEYGNRLVIVASQELREYVLIGMQVSNCIDLNPIQFCVLEKIGRARYQGEITQGKRSLQVIGEDPKSLFYHRKTLLKYKLITKQVYYKKVGAQNFSGTLLHLQRFYNERKSKQLMLTEQIVDYLRNKPNYRAQYAELTKQINLVKPLKKLLKSQEFQRFVQTDVKIPYRQYFPESENTKEWKHKSCDKEKVVRCIQLIDPNVDVAENWNINDPEEEDDNESGYQNYGNLIYGMPLLPQAAAVVRSRGENGCCQTELGELMGVSKLCARSFCRNLVRRNVVTCIMNDVGRQRVTRFASRKYENQGFLSLQLKQEREKMINLMSITNTNLSACSSNNEDKEIVDIIDDNSLHSNISSQVDLTIDNGVDETQQTMNNKEAKEDTIETNVDETELEPPSKKLKLSLDKQSEEDTSEPPTKMLKLNDIDTELQKSLDNIQVKLVVTKTIPGLKGYSKGFAEQLKTESKGNNKIEGSRMTYRILRRANFIIESIREVKVIADMTKLIKMIQDNEKDEGYHAKIDKKSLLRLVLKLSKEGHVKYMRATLNCSDKTKSISFICDPNIDENHSLIQSSIEQAKMKFHLSSKIPEPKTEKKVETEVIEYDYDRNSAKLYGFCPKFIRMRLIHEIMFYLVYEEQVESLSNQEDYKEWLDSMNISYDDNLISEFTPVYYKKELNWKTFIPPVPAHADWSNGWILICDILLRMPLHIFVQCFSVMYQIEGLEYYLDHPVRKNFLVKHLPAKIRNALMYKRRYIFQMHEICTRLCYCGLLQFGHQKLKEKDQVFVYINKKTSLLNTTTSEEGYHEISPKEYDCYLYNFETSIDIEEYWYDLWSTCMNTSLGGRLCVNGKYIVLEQLHTKQAMIEAIQPRTPEEVLQKDNGEVPGNRRGAAGLDSALFAHLRRNWNWNCNNDIGCELKRTRNNSGSVKIQKPFNLKEYMEGVKQHVVAGPARALNKITRKSNRKPADNNPKKYKMTRKTIVRKVVPKKNSKLRKPFYDEIDKMALLKLGKLRTDWSPLEDHILLLCTIGSKYLCPNRHKQIISFTVVRDVLHKLVKSSDSKTSRACQRRILYIMKNKNTRHSVQMCLEEINQSESISKKYKHICKRIHNGHIAEVEMNIAFIELVSYMSTMFSKLIEPGKKIQIPSSVDKFKEKFRVCGSFRKSGTNYKEPVNVTDITLSVIRTVIHSSMCSTKDKTSWAYQLFKIYQQYPETLLRSVITKTRNEQMIAIKKSYVRKHKTKSSNMPLSSSPYQLSITYKHQLHTKFPYTIYEEAYNILSHSIDYLNNQKNSKEGIEIVNPLSGTAIALMELTSKVNITYSFEIPDEIIVLDQTVQNDKYYERIIKRYYNFINDPNKAETEEKNQSNSKEEEENFPDFNINEIKKNVENYSSPLRTTSSRIAFYMMRAEMCEGIDEKSTQHMHDFFVVNACRVFIHFPYLEKIQNLEPESIHKDYLKIKNKVVPNLLSEIKYNAIITDEIPSKQEIIQTLKDNNANEEDLLLADKIINYILEQGIFGATSCNIMALIPETYNGNLLMQELLDILIISKVVLCTGVERMRYVHYEYKNPWIVNSYKILRLDREKLPVVTTATKEKLSIKLFKKRANYHANEVEKSRERLNLNSQEMVKVLMSPWIRIDGTLNRRVLDRWLGTILIACLQQPGISLQKLIQTYTFLRPVELHNLVQYLVRLKCVVPFVIKKSKTTLFSSLPTSVIEYATGLEDPKDILLEPYNDASIKYAIFVGKKGYNSDFLST